MPQRPDNGLWGKLYPGGDRMNRTELKEKALSLPLAPGVYLMQNEANEVIYVGKAKS